MVEFQGKRIDRVKVEPRHGQTTEGKKRYQFMRESVTLR